MKIGKRKGSDKVELMMTPMIDIVFQLLVFFIMSFKIVAQEGDFTIKMPLAAQGSASLDALAPPIKVKLRAQASGELAQISVNERNFGSWAEVNNYIIGLVGTESGPGSARESAEVELDCDSNLHFVHVIEAITAVSGYVGSQGEVVKLIEKIKFTPRAAG